MKIAGQAALIHSLFDSTKDYCARYLTEDAPVLEVTVTRQDLVREQAFLDAEADEEGLRRRVFTDPFLERAVIQRKLAEQLLSYGVLLLHGSAVAVDGKGYLFTAACGTGKSTHTRLWRQVFGGRVVMINDDKPFLQFTDNGIFVCGAPWSGKHGLDTNITAALRGICILERGQENTIAPASAPEAFLRHQCQAPTDPALQPCFDKLLQRLTAEVPVYTMQCRPDPQAAQISYNAMKS